MKYYIVINRQPQGPFDLHELLLHGLTPTSLVWTEGMPDWQQAQHIEELRKLLYSGEYAEARQEVKKEEEEHHTPASETTACPPNPAYPPYAGAQSAQGCGQQQQAPYGQAPYGASQGQQQPPYGQQYYGAQAGGYNPYNNQPQAYCPTTWLWQSIVVTILCCLPLGIVGIIYASRVQELWAQGRQAEAERASRTAKNWTLAGFVLSLAGYIIYFLFIAFGIIGAAAFNL